MWERSCKNTKDKRRRSRKLEWSGVGILEVNAVYKGVVLFSAHRTRNLWPAIGLSREEDLHLFLGLFLRLIWMFTWSCLYEISSYLFGCYMCVHLVVDTCNLPPCSKANLVSDLEPDLECWWRLVNEAQQYLEMRQISITCWISGSFLAATLIWDVQVWASSSGQPSSLEITRMWWCHLRETFCCSSRNSLF